MRKQQNTKTDHDTQWKEVITNYWESFIQFFLPQAHPLIDFTKEPVFLEQELHQIIKDKTKPTKKINDKLVKAYLKDGSEQWILLHIEIQSNHTKNFTERMFVYFYRIYDKYKVKTTALAIYTNDTPPLYDHFKYDYLGTSNTYKFNTYLVKNADEGKLIKSKNPFALVVLAAKYWNTTKNDHHKRYSFKWKLMRLALRENYYRENIVSLVEFIEFLLILPDELDRKFTYSLIEFINQEDMERTRKITPLIKAFMDMSWGTNIEQMEIDMKKKEEEAKRKIASMKRKAQEASAKEQEAKRKAQEASAKEQEAKRKAQEASAKEQEAIQKLLLKGILSYEEIAEIMGVSLKKVTTIQKNMQKK